MRILLYEFVCEYVCVWVCFMCESASSLAMFVSVCVCVCEGERMYVCECVCEFMSTSKRGGGCVLEFVWVRGMEGGGGGG